MSKHAIKPLDNLVLAKVDEAPNKTASGLYLPESNQEKPETATITAIGPKVKRVAVKDKIIYEGYSATKIKHDNVEYILVPEKKILATIS